MGKYWRLIGHITGEAQTYEAAAGAFQTSPYTPDADGRLVGLRLIIGQEAATSLVDNLQVRLTCTTFTPNTIHIAGAGGGLCTATKPEVKPVDYEVDQPVKAGVPITVESRNADATAVTVNAMVMGCFTTSG